MAHHVPVKASESPDPHSHRTTETSFFRHAWAEGITVQLPIVRGNDPAVATPVGILECAESPMPSTTPI
jgi:hypothetical protein